jgi:DNA-binding transcriptional LysR family regulator
VSSSPSPTMGASAEPRARSGSHNHRSNRISALERRIGRRLFNRSTRGAALTPAGERLVPHARRVLQAAEDAQAAVRTPHFRQPIRVLLSTSYAPVLLPAVVDAFESGPRPLSVSYEHGPNVVRAVAVGEADIGFLAPCPHPNTVLLRSLGSSPVVAVVAPEHPLVQRRRATLADLADHPIAVSAWGNDADVFLEQLPGGARVSTVVPVFAAAQLARDRGYVTLAPQAALAADLRSHVLVQLSVVDLPTAATSLALATHRASAIAVSSLVSGVRRALAAPSARR